MIPAWQQGSLKGLRHAMQKSKNSSYSPGPTKLVFHNQVLCKSVLVVIYAWRHEVFKPSNFGHMLKFSFFRELNKAENVTPVSVKGNCVGREQRNKESGIIHSNSAMIVKGTPFSKGPTCRRLRVHSTYQSHL